MTVGVSKCLDRAIMFGKDSGGSVKTVGFGKDCGRYCQRGAKSWNLVSVLTFTLVFRMIVLKSWRSISASLNQMVIDVALIMHQL